MHDEPAERKIAPAALCESMKESIEPPRVLRVERPWGSFQQFVANEPVTVKMIRVLPGCRLSLQRHERRSEYWQVVLGDVEVRLQDARWIARPGDQVWIPAKQAHRMSNVGEGPALILELAFGEFSEDDIVRISDDFGRV